MYTENASSGTGEQQLPETGEAVTVNVKSVSSYPQAVNYLYTYGHHYGCVYLRTGNSIFPFFLYYRDPTPPPSTDSESSLPTTLLIVIE